MEPTKCLYRKLAKLYHPDTARSQADRVIFEKLMVVINDAGSRCDLPMLQQIILLGPAYLAVGDYKKCDYAGVSASPTAAEFSSQAPSAPESIWPGAVEFFCATCHPYALYTIFGDWEYIGRSRKVVAIAASVSWNIAFYKTWGLLDALSLIAKHAGYPHESTVGLGIVLARGILLLISIPCCLPLLLVSVFVGFICIMAYFTNCIAVPILGYFHPALSHVPPFIIVPIAAVMLWRALGRSS
ncbi:MAG: J domain-containing protein [Terrimicrobiaceae bacterium]